MNKFLLGLVITLMMAGSGYTKNFEKGLIEAMSLSRMRQKPTDIFVNEFPILFPLLAIINIPFLLGSE